MNSSQPESLARGQEAYVGQFRLAPDILHIAIPKSEIVAEMRRCGEEQAIDHVCMAVAIVVDAIESARHAR